MAVDPAVLGVILAMAVATYATRAGGLLLIRWSRPGRFLEAWLGHVPGAMFMALIVPALGEGGLADGLAAAVAVAAMRLTGNLFIALALAVATAALLRGAVGG